MSDSQIEHKKKYKGGKRIKIGYFADGPWSHEALKHIKADPSMEIRFICARHKNPDEYLRLEAEKLGIDFFSKENINDEESKDMIMRYDADLFVSMSFNQIFKRSTYEIPELGTINCHAGKLPYYRGRNVLNWALINDEKEFGVTIHYVDDGIDTGDIILQKICEIKEEDNYETLLKKAYQECGKLLHEAIRQIHTGTEIRISQESISKNGLICSKRQVGDEIIDWSNTSREIYNFVRAICRPGPEAQTYINEHVVRINKVKLIDSAPVYKGIPGAILSKETDGLLVKTGDNYIKIIEWTSKATLKVGARFK